MLLSGIPMLSLMSDAKSGFALPVKRRISESDPTLYDIVSACIDTGTCCWYTSQLTPPTPDAVAPAANRRMEPPNIELD